MGIRLPSSHAVTRFGFSPIDVTWAALSPPFALYLRATTVDWSGATRSQALYCLVSVAGSLVAFAMCRIHIGLPRYLSAHDFADLAKAVSIAELGSCVLLFGTTLRGIPPSTPVIHALLLWSGLVAARMVPNLAARRLARAEQSPPAAREHVVLIGLNDLSAFFIHSLEAFRRDRRRVVAVLDVDPRWIGRTLHGIPVLGQPRHLDAVVEEFATHGVRADRVVVTTPPELLPDTDLAALEAVCSRRGLELERVARPFSLQPPVSDPSPVRSSVRPSTRPVARQPPTASRYFRRKRLIDLAACLVLAVVLAPLWGAAALLAWLCIGVPVVFWQRRIGRDGCDFDLYKLRTLRPPIDRQGRRIVEADRLSLAGRMLRGTRIDELPQLWNVFRGDMSLVGPRPLLPKDQPAHPAGRLMVRPGVTGWAQVNGGNALNAEEKQALDEWYVGHATVWLDLRIIAMTLVCVLRGDRRNETALAAARVTADASAGGLPLPAID